MGFIPQPTPLAIQSVRIFSSESPRITQTAEEVGRLHLCHPFAEAHPLRDGCSGSTKLSKAPALAAFRCLHLHGPHLSVPALAIPQPLCLWAAICLHSRWPLLDHFQLCAAYPLYATLCLVSLAMPPRESLRQPAIGAATLAGTDHPVRGFNPGSSNLRCLCWSSICLAKNTGLCAHSRWSPSLRLPPPR